MTREEYEAKFREWLPFIRMLARYYHNRYHPMVSVEDLVQMACEQLLRYPPKEWVKGALRVAVKWGISRGLGRVGTKYGDGQYKDPNWYYSRFRYTFTEKGEHVEIDRLETPAEYTEDPKVNRQIEFIYQFLPKLALGQQKIIVERIINNTPWKKIDKRVASPRSYYTAIKSYKKFVEQYRSGCPLELIGKRYKTRTEHRNVVQMRKMLSTGQCAPGRDL